MEETANEPKHLALVATNDDRLGQLLAAMLTPVGFSVKLIRRGASKDLHLDDFDLLVLDGDPAYSISGLAPAVVVISPSDQIAMYDAGADLVINKPLVANIFLARIRSVLRRYGIRL